MTGRVVDLADRRRIREERIDCPGCTAGRKCFPHRLDALAARLRGAQLGRDSLFIAASDVDAMVTDALEVIDGITRECLPAHARVADPNNPNNPDRRVK